MGRLASIISRQSLFPCNECAKKIAQKEIKEIIYLSEKHQQQDFHLAAVKIFEVSGIKMRKLVMPPLLEVIKKFSEFLAV